MLCFKKKTDYTLSKKMLIRSKLIVIVSFIILKSLSAIDTDPNEVSLNGGLLESKQTIRGKVLRLVIVHVRKIEA